MRAFRVACALVTLACLAGTYRNLRAIRRYQARNECVAAYIRDLQSVDTSGDLDRALALFREYKLDEQACLDSVPQ